MQEGASGPRYVLRHVHLNLKRAEVTKVSCRAHGVREQAGSIPAKRKHSRRGSGVPVRPQIITLSLSIKSKHTTLDLRGEHPKPFRGKERGPACSDSTDSDDRGRAA